ncbi:hypothetical protein [Brevibacterium ravenspurgense]|uniref:hypothetical protein n=1 Tax=Brevibacterium ravenspurgense TaxID=479117 RepID=UPI0002F4EF32|nr:hypothetical protein [Brevibacterium ravenspurgense]
MFSPYRLALTRLSGQQFNRSTTDEVEGTSATTGTSAGTGTSQAPGQQPLHLFS